MIAPLHMVKLVPNMPRLSGWAYSRRLAGRRGDLGYALHAALAEAFGEAAPKPFRLFEPRAGGNGAVPALYGYCAADEEAVRERAALADPDVFQALGLDTLAVKPMPIQWRTGRTLDFDVRVWPVVRTDRSGDRARVQERDAFLAALPSQEAPQNDDDVIRREDVYCQWVASRLDRNGAAAPVDGSMHMTAFQRSRIQRRGRRGEDGHRPLREFEGPDAIFTGTLEVRDGNAFDFLVRRGIGRHRAFGFGMLMLRPARARR
jgi:CRISPR system Cascade subunit CasE